jgi:hypothetical protein
MSEAPRESLAVIFKQIEQEGEERGARLEILRLRKLLALAYCQACGDQLGEDGDIITEEGEPEELVHRRCVEP